MSFVHLHTHTPFSYLDGASSIEALVAGAVRMDMPALAVTDHDNLSAAVRFQKAARAAGIKPILGAEITISDFGFRISDFGISAPRNETWDNSAIHLTLLAENREGYATLCQMLTEAHLSNPRGQPRLKIGNRKSEIGSGLIALSGCRRGLIPTLIRQRRFEEAKEVAKSLAELFGPGSFYLELQQTFVPGDRQTGHYLSQLARALKLKTVATNDVHYITKQGHRVQDLLTCIRHILPVDTPHPERKINGEYYLKSPQEMAELFADYPEALHNALEVAQRCEDLDLQSQRCVPKFAGVPKGQTPEGYLRELAYKGAAARYRKITPALRQRLDYELEIISQLGFADYFLVVWDFALWARRRRIRLAGRGSAADSAVAYCLYITSVDAFARNLRFERFINPERANNLPDIDLDFDARYRDAVTQYATDLYGADHVATVCTFNRYRARGALRDLGKVLQFPPEEIDRLAKLMPWIDADEIPEAFTRFPELRDSPVPCGKFEQLFEFCAAVADHPRHIGTHLGGIVISGESLSSLSPLQRAAKGVTILQFDKDDVEDLGLLKLDLLCLRMLSAVEDTSAEIAKTASPAFDFDAIPLDDTATYRLLNSGETAGAFQLESAAQRALQTRLKADNIEDIVVSVALIRPGPIQGDMVTPFLRRRQGKEPVTYLHPDLEQILGKTYGVVLYQEQVIEIAVKIACFTPGEADVLRRLMTHHRSKTQMAEFGEKFIARAMERGIERKVAETIFSYIQGYAGYGFCEAHAAAFGDTAYKTAYLLTHYPAQFYAGLLNNQPMGFFPPHTLVTEARRRGIPVLGPDINRSHAEFTVELAPCVPTLPLSPCPENSLPTARYKVTTAMGQRVLVPSSPGEKGLPARAKGPDAAQQQLQIADCRLPICNGATGAADAEDSFRASHTACVDKQSLALRIGLKQVRGICEKDSEAILAARSRPFLSLADFRRRVRIPRPVLENLVLCGAFDSLNPHRRHLMWELESSQDAGGALGLEVPPSSPLPDLADFGNREKFSFEWDLLGFSPRWHPMEFARHQLRRKGVLTAAQIKKKRPGTSVLAAGLLIRPHRPPTRSGRTVVFLSLEDETGLIEVTVFEDTYQKYGRVLFTQPALMVKGTLNNRAGVSVVAESLSPLSC